jgi:uncharacterized repeat protein (TIGR01451 family)
MPARKAALVSAAVVISTLIVFATVTVIAPILASRPPARLTPEELQKGTVRGALLAGPRLRTGDEAESTLGPSPTATSRGETAGPTAASLSPGTPDPPSAAPSDLAAAMSVSAREASAGDHLVYTVTVTNRGTQTYNGAFTVNTHTPAGTIRCSEGDVELCTTPGDHDGSSSDPNDPHVNPTGSTVTVKVKPGTKVVLLRIEVVVAALSGAVLHNHAHVDGVGSGDGSATVEPGQVGVAGLGVPGSRSGVAAPDVVVR